MQAEYWLSKWRSGKIGFHEVEINRWLTAHGETVFAGGKRVIAPLCGKSLDLLWLEQQGLEVVGVELAREAIVAFFAENERAYQEAQYGAATRFTSGDITIWQADWFDLPVEIGRFDRVFDRAALIALPFAMRQRYVVQLSELLEPAAQGMLVTISYDQQAMPGPPFSVDANELAALYSNVARRQLDIDEDALATNGKFRERGVAQLSESVWQLNWPAA